ncbi:MAG: hypothetical protein EXQ91_02920 [Alphaproteobacteria bacterium]|nr:hypothetical protein [Alphaproteobacteria bacterium]
MNRIRHIAIVVTDMEKASDYYKSVFGLVEAGRDYTPTGNGLYLSDGEINLALLNYKSDAMAGIKNSGRFIGAHHFGIQVEDVDKAQAVVEKNGGSFHFDLGHEKEGNFERKLRDPNGVIFDVSKGGWVGTPTRNVKTDKKPAPKPTKSAKIRHIAITSPDPEKTAKFYEISFGLKRVGDTKSELSDGIYLTDGYITLAILKYLDDKASGRGEGFIGTHHFGLQVESLEESGDKVTAAGGKFFFDVPGDNDSLYFERKYRDPDGIIFDISKNGWWSGAKH